MAPQARAGRSGYLLTVFSKREAMVGIKRHQLSNEQGDEPGIQSVIRRPGKSRLAIRYLTISEVPPTMVSARVAVNLFGATELLGDAVAAENLHGFIGAEVCRFGGDQFCHRSFLHQRLAVAAGVIHFAGPIGEQFRRIDSPAHLRDLVPDQLFATERLAETLALLRMRHRDIECAARNAKT